MISRRRLQRTAVAVGAIGLLTLAVAVPGTTAAADTTCAGGTTLGPVDLGCLTDHLFVFTDGSQDANWQSSSKGYVGNVAVDGLDADERTSGTIAYRGVITTNDTNLGAWQKIVTDNPTQASSATGAQLWLQDLTATLTSAIATIDGLVASPGYEDRSAQSLHGLNTQDGQPDEIVINVTKGLKVSTPITITGDAEDLFFLRWDADRSASGLQGQVKFQSGGAIVPGGDLGPSSFVHIAGDINASGGGSTPPAPYPQGPRLDDGTGALITGGKDFSGGGFFTGYWLTTGAPDTGRTASLSNAVFVGGWYSLTTKFSMTSGTSGVHVGPPAGGGGYETTGGGGTSGGYG